MYIDAGVPGSERMCVPYGSRHSIQETTVVRMRNLARLLQHGEAHCKGKRLGHLLCVKYEEIRLTSANCGEAQLAVTP